MNLTAREEQILILVIDGYSYNQIAKKLFISPSTVRTVIHNLYIKFDCPPHRSALIKKYNDLRVPVAALKLHLMSDKLTVQRYEQLISRILSTIDSVTINDELTSWVAEGKL